MTKEGPPCLISSSIGEVYHKVGEKTAEEGLLKIISMEDRVVTAFSGNVLKANAIIEYVKYMVEMNDDMESIINGIEKTIGPFEKDRDVSLIIGAVHDDAPVIYLWNSADLTLRKVNHGIAQIGSMDSFHREFNRFLLSFLAKGNIPADRLLPIALAVMQSYTVHEDMLSQFVGGIHYGILMTSKETLWHEDIKYVLYGPELRALNIITCLCRDGVVIVRSSITKDTRVLMHTGNTTQPAEWVKNWKKNLDDYFATGKAKYWVFIGVKQRNITVVKMPEPKASSKYFKLENIGGGVYDFAIEDTFKAFLLKPLDDRDDGRFPFRLTCMDA